MFEVGITTPLGDAHPCHQPITLTPDVITSPQDVVVDPVTGDLPQITDALASATTLRGRVLRWAPIALLTAYLAFTIGAMALHMQRQRADLGDVLDAAVFLM